jgi:poly-gamma-glutamate synthesis protein (capsule biosynthesis protein)
MSIETTKANSSECSVRVAIVGDIMPGSSAIRVGWGMAETWPGERFWGAIEPAVDLFRAADIVIGNLEAPLVERGEGSSALHRNQMRGYPGVATALRRAGFSVISVANNHAVQHGVSGFDSTVNALQDSGMLVAGLKGAAPWTSRPTIVDVRGLKIGVLAYCWRPRQYSTAAPPFSEGCEEDAIADILLLKGTCDSIIVSLHWGDEFITHPSAEQVVTAERLVEAGANVVVGHHPHVIRPAKYVGSGIVVHSLGNFVSDMTWYPPTRLGGVLLCELSRQGVKNVDIRTIETNDNLQVEVSNLPFPMLEDGGLAWKDYQNAERTNLNDQRLHAYRFALANLLRYETSVLLEIVFRTAKNKIWGLFGR